MFKINFRKIILNFIIILVIFLIDRLSKNYILKILELESTVNIYITQYLNFFLVWNKGIAFGLLSFEENLIYQAISLIILIISIVLIFMIIKSKGIKQYALISVLGGAISNLYDRVYYSAVPDFIDFHINNFHWFTFNIADIFITMGIILIITKDLIFNK